MQYRAKNWLACFALLAFSLGAFADEPNQNQSVGASAATTAKDVLIKTKAKAALLKNHKKLKGSKNISIEANNGVVVAKGCVINAAQKNRVEKIIKSIDGVSEVQDESLVVKERCD